MSRKMQGLANVMRAQALMAMGSFGAVRVGLVTSYDPDNYAVKCTLQPDEKETGWLPLASPWVGNGWGLFAPPSIGDMVDVHYQEGSHEAGYACWRFYNDQDRPLSVPSGEFWLVHSSGAALKFKNDGKVSLHSGVEVDVGDLEGSLHKLVTDAFVALFNAHTHTETGSTTSPPTTPMTDAHMTTILRGN